MREHIQRAKRRIKNSARIVAGVFRRRHSDPRVSDVRENSAAQTVMLRQRSLKVEFELNRRNILKFFKKYKIPVIAGFTVLVMGLFVRFFLVGLATTADFYPSSCLGSWDNVQNALGTPDLTPFSQASDFTSLNSAVFSTSTDQMFCGNFLSDTDLSQLEGKNFQSADIVLSWYVQEQGAAPAGGGYGSSPGSGSGNSLQNDNGDATSTVATDTLENASTDVETAASEPTTTQATSGDDASGTVTPQGSSTDITASSSDTSDASSSEDIDTSSSSDNTESTTTIATTTTATGTTTAATTTDTGIDTDANASSTTTVVATTTSESNNAGSATSSDGTGQGDDNTLSPNQDSSDSSTPSAWLFHLIPTAFADENSSSVMMTSTQTYASSGVSAVPTATATVPAAPMTINTAMFQNIVLPSSTPDDFLGIVYSTDGVTWQPLVNIHGDNWQAARYPIPITSWDELDHLQVAFVGLGNPNAPIVYLDSVGVEVSYVDAPQPSPTISPTDENDQGDVSSTEPQDQDQVQAEQGPDTVIQKTDASDADVFDQGALQQCVVAPFTATIPAGSSADLSLQLFSGLTTPSTTFKKGKPTSTLPDGYQHAIYQVRFGSLPPGVSGSMNTDGTATDASSSKTIHLAVNSGAAPGSYSLLVIYRERQDDASLRSTACQFNLVIQ